MLNNAPTYLSVVEGDKGYQINFTCQDSQGNVVNLSGATLTFNAQLDSDGSIQSSNAMGLITPSSGTCYYQLIGTEFPVVGTYNCQIVASYSSGSEILTFDGIQVAATARIPQ
jgi:hypothetical protein